MDNVLHRQYEQYKQSKENIRLINRRYHELKMQIAAIRAERDKVKQDAALAEMEGDIHRYEAENRPATRCWTPCLPPKVCTASSTAST